MFAEQDVRDIFTLVPPEYQPNFKSSGILPPIVFASSGDGLLTEKSVIRAFERLIRDESNRVSLANVVRKLDVDAEVALRLVKTSSHLALLSEDELTVITLRERESIAQRLEELVASQIVSRSTFSRENDISRHSFDALIHSQKDSVKFLKADEYVSSRAYEQVLSKIFKERLDHSLQDLESFELSPPSLPGSPPVWYIRQILKDALDRHELASRFHVDEDAVAIRCIPKESTVRRRDAVILQLQSAEVPYLDVRTFAENFKELFSNPTEASHHLEDLPSIILSGSFAISETWLATIGKAGVQALADNGCFDCIAELPANLPQAVREDVLEKVVNHINTAHTSGSDSLHRIGGLMLTESQYGIKCGAIVDLAGTQAADQWQTSKTTPDKGFKFQVSSVLGAIPPEQSILRAVAQEKGLESLAAEAFSNEISRLESKNESEFSAFWIKRMTSRVQNYREGLAAVEDTKLHDQLADVLSTYLQKELILDTVAKARTQELTCSRKTQKNVQKLEAALKASKQDLTSIVSSVEKFSKKQGVQDVEVSSLAEAKSILVADMIRRMQKPKTDGPLLFLTLVIVLFARHYPGVVYATGKFAPKLLKQLKPRLSTEEYDQIENWKEQAKSGTLTPEDQRAMVQKAEQQ